MSLLCLSDTAVEGATIWENIKGVFQVNSPHSPTLRILIAHDLESATLEVQGKYRLFDPHDEEHIGTRFIGKKQRIEALGDGLKWGEAFPGIHQLTFVPAQPKTRIALDGVEYPGTLTIYDVGGTISVVNEVLIEELLKIVLPQSYPQAQIDELCAAIAIAARTNAYYDHDHPRNKFWDVTASALQYQGVAHPSAIWNKALEETKYMVMSSTSAYEKVVTPFPVDWHPDGQAEEMAKKGLHAAQILAQAFPGKSIQIADGPRAE